MSAANIDRAIKAIEEVVQAALNGQAGMGTLRPDWILERLFPLLADLAQEHSDAMELRLENKGLRRDREALALGIIPAPVSELAALRERLRLLERTGKQTMFVLTVDVPGYEVDAVVETWKNLLPESPAASGAAENAASPEGHRG